MRKQNYLRDRLDGDALLRNINELLGWILLGYRPIYAPPPPNTPSRKANLPNLETTVPIAWEALQDQDLKSLTVVLNAQFKLLSKVLPELKAVEMTDVSSHNRLLSDLELAQRITSVLSTPSQSQSQSRKTLQ